MNVNVSVFCHAGRAHRTGTVLVITTAEEMIHGTDTGIAGVDEDVYSSRVSTLRVRVVCFCLYVYPHILENPVPPSSVPALHHISHVP